MWQLLITLKALMLMIASTGARRMKDCFWVLTSTGIFFQTFSVASYRNASEEEKSFSLQCFYRQSSLDSHRLQQMIIFFSCSPLDSFWDFWGWEKSKFEVKKLWWTLKTLGLFISSMSQCHIEVVTVWRERQICFCPSWRCLWNCCHVATDRSFDREVWLEIWILCSSTFLNDHVIDVVLFSQRFTVQPSKNHKTREGFYWKVTRLFCFIWQKIIMASDEANAVES